MEFKSIKVPQIQNELRVFYPPYFPAVSVNCTRYPSLHVTQYCTHPGLFVEILNEVTTAAGIKIIPVYEKDHSRTYTPEELYTWNSKLINGTIDLIAVGWQRTIARNAVYSFSESLYTVQTRLLRRVQETHFEKMFSFFQTYDLRIWLAVLLIWLLQWGCCVLSQRMDWNRIGDRMPSIGESAWQVLRLQLLQARDDPQQPQAASSRFSLNIFAFFQCYVLLGLFSSFILVTLLKPVPEVDNPLGILINEVIRKEYSVAATDIRSWVFENINYSNSYPYPEIRKALETNPIITIKSYEEGFKLARDGKIVIYYQTDSQGAFVVKDQCDLVPLERGMPTEEARLMFRKGHPFLERIDRAINATRPKLRAILAKYSRLAIKDSKCPEKKSYNPQQFIPYVGAIIVCFCLILVATFVLFTEILFCKRNRN